MTPGTVPWPLPSTCAACILRLSRSAQATRPLGSYIQFRGKKKNAKHKTSIPVRLIQDVPGYGRKGSIVPLGVGQMRNTYFPRRVADYVTLAEAKDLKRNGIIPERDYTFGKEALDEATEAKGGRARSAKGAAKATSKGKPVRVKLDMLPPALAFDALKGLLPPTLVFYRTPISPGLVKPDVTPQPTTSTEGEPGPSESLYPAQTSPIYGSVNTGDVATSVKALIASSDVAGRIILNEEDIRFVHVGPAEDTQKEDATRIKHLGDFDIEIKIKGHSELISRQVKVLSEADAQMNKVMDEEEDGTGEILVDGDANLKVSKLESMTRKAEEILDKLAEEGRELIHKERSGNDVLEPQPMEEGDNKVVERMGQTK